MLFRLRPFAACLFILAGTASAADPATSTAPASQPAREVIKVKTVKEFLAAIGSNRVIQLSPGDYDLSEIPHTNSRQVHWGLMAGGDDALIMRHVENLTIECVGEKPARISTPEADSYIIGFNDATNVTLKNIEMVHDVAGECGGGVLMLNDSRGVTLDHCTISGCGREGITAWEVDGLIFRNSTITHCSDSMMSAIDLSHAEFIDSTFQKNTFTTSPLSIAESHTVDFKNCTFADNKRTNIPDDPAYLIYAVGDACKISFTGCFFTNNTGTSAAVANATGVKIFTFKDCTFKDNSFKDPAK